MMRSSDRGQSLVETALALPLVLLVLLGLVDLGRGFYYKIAVTDAAREAASYAARTTGATSAQVAQVACNETGFTPYGSACPSAIQVTYVAPTSTAYDATLSVTVTYRMSLVTGNLVGRVFPVNPVGVSATATYPRLK